MIDDIANRVGPARAWVSADRVHAGPLRGTIVILGTLNFEDRFSGSAGTAATADVSARTHAYHGAYRMCRQDPTLGRLGARLYNRARNLAFVAQTGE